MSTPLIALTWDNGRQEADLALADNGFLDSASGFETAVTISLFTHAYVENADVTLTGTHEGWWGDTYADPEGDLIGSRLWTLRRSKVNADTIGKVKAFCKEALQWMLDDGIAKAITTEAERFDTHTIAVKISIVRRDGGQWTGIWEIHLDAL